MDKRRLELLIEFAKINNIQSAEQAIDACNDAYITYCITM